MISSQPTYYELLGLKPDATEAEIKSAFRRAAKRNHPDQGGNAVLFHMIEEAYETLVDPVRRADYDALSDDPLQFTPPGGVYMNRDPDAYQSAGEPTSTWDAGMWRGDAPARKRMRAPRFMRGIKNVAWHKIAITAIVGWVIISLFTGSFSAVSTLAGLALFAMSVWFLGSLTMRLMGWVLVFWGLIDAHWNNASGLVTVGRVGVGIGLWLCGHWFFTWRKGYWRSVVAFSILSKLPRKLQPDRHWGNTAI